MKPFITAYIDAYAFSSLSDTFDQLKLINRLIKLRKNITKIVKGDNIRLRLFSDFLFITYDLSNLLEITEENHVVCEDRAAVRSAIRTFVDKLISIYNVYLDHDLLLRGGVTVGNITSNNNIMIGKAVTDAVRLESQGIAPVIMFPEKYLDMIGLPGWNGILELPLKNDRLISSIAILPSDSQKFIEKLDDMREKEIYYMTKYSGILNRAYIVSLNILSKYRLIEELKEDDYG